MSPERVKELVARWPRIYDAIVERILNSPDPAVSRQFFLGLGLYEQHPVLYPYELQFLGALLLGDPGSNKTSNVSSLATQMIAARDRAVIIIDPKDDAVLRERSRLEAVAADIPWYGVTTIPRRSSRLFNLFKQPFWSKLTVTEQTQQLLQALALAYQEVYGQGFFASEHESHLMNILERFGPCIHSFADLYRYCSDRAANKGQGSPKSWENAGHLHSILYRISKNFVLNATEQDFPHDQRPIQGAIHIEEMLTRPCVGYFCLPSRRGGANARCISRLVLSSFVAAADVMKSEGRETIGATIFMDEFHALLSAGIESILATARDLKIGCIMATQTLEQFKISPELDLRQVILSLTAFRQIFRAGDLATREFIQKSSGEACFDSLSWKQAIPAGWPDGRSEFHGSGPPRFSPEFAVSKSPWDTADVSVEERISSRLSPNEIMEISANQFLSFVNFTANTEFSNYDGAWVPTISGYHITADEYREALKAPWPAADPYCIVVPRDSPHLQSRAAAAAVRPARTEDAIDARVQQGIDERVRRKQRGLFPNAPSDEE